MISPTQMELQAVYCLPEEENPGAFGVAKFDDQNNIIDIMEKPANPPSSIAIGGIYLYDENFWKYIDECCGRFGDDFPITEVNRIYVKLGKAKLVNIGKETWVDCGTPDSLLQASIMAKEGKLNPNPHR